MQEALQLPEAALGRALLGAQLRGFPSAVAVAFGCGGVALATKLAAVKHAAAPAASLAAQGGILAAFALGLGDFAAQVLPSFHIFTFFPCIRDLGYRIPVLRIMYSKVLLTG